MDEHLLADIKKNLKILDGAGKDVTAELDYKAAVNLKGFTIPDVIEFFHKEKSIGFYKSDLGFLMDVPYQYEPKK